VTAGQHPASGGRRKSRELAMQMLYQADIGKQTPRPGPRQLLEAADEVEPKSAALRRPLRVAVEHQEQIDELLVANSKHWRLERMPAVDRNLLRMAVGEMLGFKGTPSPSSSTKPWRSAAASPPRVHQLPQRDVGWRSRAA